MCRHDADQRQRNRRHDDQRHNEGPEPADHKHVDENQHGGKRKSHIAEDLDGDVPLAVPLHRVVVGRVGIDAL